MVEADCPSGLLPSELSMFFFFCDFGSIFLDVSSMFWTLVSFSVPRILQISMDVFPSF